MLLSIFFISSICILAVFLLLCSLSYTYAFILSLLILSILLLFVDKNTAIVLSIDANMVLLESNNVCVSDSDIILISSLFDCVVLYFA